MGDNPPPIAGYQLLERIGEGGMGEVYRAHQLDPPRTVAVKFLTRLPSDETAILAQRFQRESELMASLRHPNVVAMYDCGRMADQFYLVMEYVSGSTLRSLMKPGEAWPVSRAAPILDGVAQALIYIHGQRVLHLDLKPENVLCDKQGVVKVTDFGLALLQADSRSATEPAVALGSVDYCAPEQRFGLQVDARSDLFSLATIAYELLTSSLPGRIYLPCAETNARVPQLVDDVLKRGLARDPDERYPTVELFRQELCAALQG